MRRLLFVLGCVLVLASAGIGGTEGQIVPVARNLLYVHVPTAISALLCFIVLLMASIGYLATGRPAWDQTARAAAEVGFVFAILLNATGMLFARAEWNVWWTPSPRLVTSALLWFLYAVYLILRVSLPGVPHRTARICAVFGILAFLDVPLVFVSARFLPDIHRPSFSLASHWQTATLLLAMLGTALLAGVWMWWRTSLLCARLARGVDRGALGVPPYES
ncbi:MAG: cytochrome c biogenesis protein [Planctomycetes bacterium]|jgi:heme exporter protein C|nr:cytochrome c biogenesis protein [Planctomycetota bacterium]